MKQSFNNDEDLRGFLEEKYIQYNTPAFIENDPVSVPHLFSDPADIEIAGFLTAVISWGRRDMITKAGRQLMDLMGNKPADFVNNASGAEIAALDRFYYRTFNGYDARVFVHSLQRLLAEYKTLENAFYQPLSSDITDMAALISRFRNRFFGMETPGRSGKHISDPMKNSAAKRINMFLRWMVRNDDKGVDFGIWKSISPSQLVCPLDLHSSNVARKLDLLNRNYNDWKAAVELTESLCKFDAKDPVKYDFALFGLGWYEGYR